MHVTESLNEGLKREYRVVIDAAQMTSRIDARLMELKKSSHIKGFRPGKVPMELFRRMYGDGVVQDVLKSTIEESSNDALSEQKIRQAMPATIQDVSFSQGENLEYVLAVEVMPEIAPLDHSVIVVSAPVVEIGEKDIEESIDVLARAAGKPAVLDDATGVMLNDRITVDIEVLVDGERNEDLSVANQDMILTDHSLPAKVLEAVKGLTTGDSVEVEDMVPGAAEESGSEALFRISLLKAERMVAHEIDDDLAGRFGCEGLEGLRESVRQELEGHFTAYARAHTKRRLLDRLNDDCDFEVPPGLVENEFQSVWKQVAPALEKQDLDEEALAREREDYRTISERRVRLGMLLAEVGRDAGIQVEQADMQTALIQQATRFPGREAEVVRHFQEHPEHLRQLTAPILEDRVVDHILDSVSCEEEVMDVEAFLGLDSEADGMEAVDAGRHYLEVARRVMRNHEEQLQAAAAEGADDDADAAEAVEEASA
ncbi:MAG: trigger factor [bacterium]|nr:trigger factor [bacterium]